MRAYKTLRNLFLLTSILSLTAAYILAGHWLIVAILLAIAAFWRVLRRPSLQWRSGVLLGVYIAAEAAGVLLGVETAFLIVGMATALAAWDLLNFGETLKSALRPQDITLLSRSHFRSLFLALGLGTALSFAAVAVDLVVPFPLMVVLALTLMVSLTRAAGLLARPAG